MSEQSSPLKPLVIAVPIVLSLCIIYGCFVYFFLAPNHGIFGDMFGALNTFFAALAFIGVILALYQAQRQIQMQSEELQLQRKELAAQRKEFARTAQAQENAEEALRKQVEMLTISSTIEIFEKASHLMEATKRTEFETQIKHLADRLLVGLGSASEE